MSPSPTDLKEAIHAGDVDQLRELLVDDRLRANALIRWGKNDCIGTHPLHYISDAIFEGILDRSKAVPLGDALLDAGSNVDFHEPGKGETPLMGADVNAEDRKYQSSPLGWALHGWMETPAGERRGRHDEVVRQLVAAGAQVKSEWLESKEIQARPEMIAALTSG